MEVKKNRLLPPPTNIHHNRIIPPLPPQPHPTTTSATTRSHAPSLPRQPHSPHNSTFGMGTREHREKPMKMTRFYFYLPSCSTYTDIIQKLDNMKEVKSLYIEVAGGKQLN